jgi:transposase
MGKQRRRKRRSFSPEFKAETVRLVQGSEKSLGTIARELDLTETALRAWVRQAEVDAGRGRAGALTTDEREELARLRRDVKRLQMERDILKNGLARPSRAPARRETPGVPTMASREEWPSTFWCSANP